MRRLFEEETDNWYINEWIRGLSCGFSSQHHWVNFHKSSVKLGFVGRSGRTPVIIFITATASMQSPNGALPVKAFVDQLSYLTWGESITSHLNYNHPEREYIRFLAMKSGTAQDFRCSKPGCDPARFGGGNKRF